MKFTLIICAYSDERWEDLCIGVESVRKQCRPPEELILVIDHNPELQHKAAEAFAECRVVANRHARGLSGSRNTGIELASGDVIAFMDDDASAAEDWLQRLEAAFTSPDVLGVGGSIIPRWDNGRPRWFPAEFDWVVGCTYKGMPKTASPVRNLIGCNMAFRKDVFEKAGGFHTQIGRIGKLPLGCEETELCIRAKQLLPDSRFMFEPEAVVHHRVPADRGTWRYFRQRCFSEGISKVHVSREVGAGDALASERTYTMRTLPLGVLKGIADVFVRFDLMGLGQAGAIVLGLFITASGYLTAMLNGQSMRPVQQEHAA